MLMKQQHFMLSIKENISIFLKSWSQLDFAKNLFQIANLFCETSCLC